MWSIERCIKYGDPSVIAGEPGVASATHHLLSTILMAPTQALPPFILRSLRSTQVGQMKDRNNSTSLRTISFFGWMSSGTAKLEVISHASTKATWRPSKAARRDLFTWIVSQSLPYTDL